MGNRKRQSALALKETKKLLAFAKLNNCHRMIHRLNDSSNLGELQDLIRTMEKE